MHVLKEKSHLAHVLECLLKRLYGMVAFLIPVL